MNIRDTMPRCFGFDQASSLALVYKYVVSFLYTLQDLTAISLVVRAK